MRSFTRFRTGLILFLCLAAGVSVLGQYRFDTWTTDNGLPQNGVREITQTPEGYLWFTTFDGLVRFDGVRFTTFNKSNTPAIINNRFTGLFSDKDGTLYATTMEDGVLTICRNGVWSSMKSEEVPGRYIVKIEFGDDGQILFFTMDEDLSHTSLYHLTDGKFEFVGKQVNSTLDVTYKAKNGSPWLVSPQGISWTTGENSNFIPLDITKANFRPNVFEDRDGSIWIGENRIHHVVNGVVKTFDESDELPGNTIYHSAWQEKDGSVWFASGGGSSTGVGLVQIDNGKVHVWGKDDGFANRLIQETFHDREGTVWLATDRGLSRRRNQVIKGVSKNDGLDHSEIYPLYRDRKGDVWIGSSKGLSIYRDGKFEPVDVKPNPLEDRMKGTWLPGAMSVQALWEDPNGKMWVGVNGGLFLVKDGIASNFVPGPHVSAIKNDRLGNVWVATSTGLYCFNDYKIKAKYSTKDGLPNEFVTFIFEDSKGTMWYGSYGGLSRFENGKFTNYTTQQGLTGDYVRTITEDADGALWIGTYDEGMSRFKGGEFVNFKKEDGLYNNGVFAIEEDSLGFFWISSNQGIYRVKRQELNDFAERKISKINSVGYGKEDGMLSTECNGGRQPASLRDENGKFWFPTQEGIAIVDPSAERENPLPPTVVIEDVLVEREPVDFRGSFVIPPGKKDIEIRFTGISLIRSDQIKFQYKLEGHDKEWIDAGTRRTAHYSYLPPGNYTFLVKAANSDGVWSEKGGELSIELSPFFYQTRLFVLLCVLFAAISLLVIWKVSVHQLEARERRLMRLVRARTEELAEANEALQQLANSDGLTKIGNRRRFESFLQDEWHRAVRFKTEISLLMIDIDHFKLYNDTYGHQAGDECLQRVAEAFAATIKRPTDLVARFGGEEFALILGGTNSAGARQIAEEAIANVKELLIEHSGSSTSRFLTVSVGIATTFPNIDISENDLVNAADRALYMAKKNGRDCIFYHDSLTQGPINADVLAQDHFVLEPK